MPALLAIREVLFDVGENAAFGRRPERPVGTDTCTGWYGDRGDTVLDEHSTPGRGFLADLRRDWEAAVFAAADHGVRTVAVRIGVVLGREGGALRALLPLFRLGLGGRVGSGQQWFSWIHLDDRPVIGQAAANTSRRPRRSWSRGASAPRSLVITGTARGRVKAIFGNKEGEEAPAIDEGALHLPWRRAAAASPTWRYLLLETSRKLV